MGDYRLTFCEDLLIFSVFFRGDTGNYYSEESLILSAFSGDTSNYYDEESLIFKFILGGNGIGETELGKGETELGDKVDKVDKVDKLRESEG